MKADIETLVKLIKDKETSPSLFWEAAEALIQADVGLVTPHLFLEFLTDKDSTVRLIGAYGLGKFGDKKFVEPLIQALKDTDRMVRYRAIRSLAQLDDDRAIPFIAALVKSKTPAVRAAAAAALCRLGDETGLEMLVKILRGRSTDLIDEAIRALVSLGEIAAPTLIDLLDDKNVYIRRAAIKLLGRIRTKQAVEPLILLLKNADPQTRILATMVLGLLHDKRAVEPLITILNDLSLESKERRFAAQALGMIGESSSIEPLLANFNSGDEKIRGSVTWALFKLGVKVGVYTTIFENKNAEENASVYSELTMTILKQGGWYPGRHISSDDYVELLEANGFTVFSVVKQFLSEYGGIRFYQKYNYSETALSVGLNFEIDRVHPEVYRSMVVEYQKHLNSQLCPFGRNDAHDVLLMDSYGLVYGGHDGYLSFYGATSEIAIENMVKNQNIISLVF